MLEKEYPKIQVHSLTEFYTSNTFFDYSDNILLTRDSFQSISPTFKTIDVDWEYQSPTGIVYALQPSEKMEKFVEILMRIIKETSYGF